MVIAFALFGLVLGLSAFDAYTDARCDTEWEAFDDCRRKGEGTWTECRTNEVSWLCKDDEDKKPR